MQVRFDFVKRSTDFCVEPRRVRRLVTRLILFLLLGVVTTLAIAWGFAYATDRVAAYQSSHIGAKVYFGEGEWHHVSQFRTGAGEIVRLDYLGGDPVRDPHIAPWDLSSWTVTHRSPREVYETIHLDLSLQEEAWGWPCLALRSAVWFEDDVPRPSWDAQRRRMVAAAPAASPKTRSAWLFDQELYVDPTGIVSGPAMLRSLPLEPIPLGLAANSALFASTWWVLLVGWRIALRRWRAHAGRCPQCGYDLRGDLARGCPECGWNRAAT